MLTVVAIYQIFKQPTVHNTLLQWYINTVRLTWNIITEWKALLFDELDDNYIRGVRVYYVNGDLMEHFIFHRRWKLIRNFPVYSVKWTSLLTEMNQNYIVKCFRNDFIIINDIIPLNINFFAQKFRHCEHKSCSRSLSNRFAFLFWKRLILSWPLQFPS